MSCYKINIDGMAYDIYAKDLKEALFAVAVSYGCSYGSLGSEYYEDGKLRSYRYNDLNFYDHILSILKR